MGCCVVFWTARIALTQQGWEVLSVSSTTHPEEAFMLGMPPESSDVLDADFAGIDSATVPNEVDFWLNGW